MSCTDNRKCADEEHYKCEIYGTHNEANFNFKTKRKGFAFKEKFPHFIFSDI